MRLLLLLLFIPSLAFANGMTNARKDSILDTEFTGTHYLALFSTACSDTTAGTELSGNGYARQSFTFASSSSGTKASASEIVFTASGGTLNGTHFGIYTAASGGTYKWCGELAPAASLLDAESYTISIGDLNVALD